MRIDCTRKNYNASADQKSVGFIANTIHLAFRLLSTGLKLSMLVISETLVMRWHVSR